MGSIILCSDAAMQAGAICTKSSSVADVPTILDSMACNYNNIAIPACILLHYNNFIIDFAGKIVILFSSLGQA